MLSFLDSLSSHTISLLALLTPIVIAIVPVILKAISKRKAFLLWRQAEMDNKFNPQFDDNEQSVLKLITSRFFIPIHGQMTAPHNGDTETDSNRVDLIKTIINNIWNGKGKMRFIIMGGSGMGKSTFSAALFHAYLFKNRFKKPPFPVYVQYLGDERSIEIIKKIVSENQDTIHSSILILDAFDENRDAALDRQKFWCNINRITHDFKVVIITCRPQFFENEDSEPAESSIWVNSPNGLMAYKKYYISPFSDSDVQSYLQAKYKLESEDYRRAKLISDKCKDLAIRPMILAFIDELKDFKGHSIPNIAELYCQIIESWLFLAEKGYQSSPYSYKERSLVNRTSEGYIKFAHKSFLEFFIAVLAFEKPGLAINPHLWDFARAFYDALYELEIKGEKLGFIDYYKPCLFTTYGFSNEDCSFHTPFKLHDWWMCNIQHTPVALSICRESEKDGFIQMMGLDLDTIQRVFFVQKGMIMSLCAVETIQKEDNSRFINLDVGKDLEDTVSEYLKEVSLSFLPSNFELKESLIMPNLFELGQEFQDIVLSSSYTNLVSVGCGLNDSCAIYNTISHLYKLGICPDLINVYREGDDLDEHVSFIVGLNSIEFKPPYILVCISYKQNLLVAFLNDDIMGSMDESTIRSILMNQIDDGKPHDESSVDMLMCNLRRI